MLVPLLDAYRIFYKQASNLEASDRFLEQRFELEDSVIFLALDDAGTGMGFTQLYPSYSSVSLQLTYILNDLYVAAEGRKQGVGAALLQRAQQYARETGSKGLTLETAVDNPAQNLYKRLGWVLDTEVNHYTWTV